MMEFEIVVNAPLEKVWAFHQKADSLLALTPPSEGARIESADEPLREGSRIVLSVKRFRGRMRWVAKIVEFRPPHAVVFGEEARFVDEQETGPFKRWRHEHDFERIDAKTTRCADRVVYSLPLGVFASPIDWLYVRPKLRRIFRYRHEQMKRLLA